MDFELTEEQKALIALARDFCRQETSPEFMRELFKRDSEDRIPWDLVEKMHGLGLVTLTVPERYGGGGADLLTQVVLTDALGQYGGLVGSLNTVNWKMCGDLAAVGNAAQQDEIFARAINDHTFSMVELTNEPEHGCDPVLPYDEPGAGLKTYAYRDGDEYVINGEKCFCDLPHRLGAPGDLAWVYVRTDKNKPLSQSMSCLLVPTGTPGFSIVRINDYIYEGIRCNGDYVFNNVRVPARNLIGEENRAFAIYDGRRAFHLPRLALSIGQAQVIYEYTKEYARTRIQGGKPIFEHLTVGTRIVDMLLHIEQARYLVYKTAWEYDQAIRAGSKLVSSLGFELCNAAGHDLSLLIANHAAEVFGGRAALKELPIEGYARGAYGGQHAFGTGTINRIKSMSMI
jgi:acyl-CoA dehydrogenase